MSGSELVRKLNEIVPPLIVGKRWDDTPFPIIHQPDYGPDGKVEGSIASAENFRKGIDQTVRDLGEDPAGWRFDWDLKEEEGRPRNECVVLAFRVTRAYRRVSDDKPYVRFCIFTKRYFVADDLPRQDAP